jgi:hypothetical protein
MVVESLVLLGGNMANYDRKMRCDIHVMAASNYIKDVKTRQQK